MRYKNMIYLTISYIPWISYWTLSAQLNSYGSLVGLLLEFCFLIKEIKDKKISYMDAVGFIYFIIATFVTCILKSNLFMKADGYAGYGTLFIMGLFSAILNKPFMKYYVNKDFENVSAIGENAFFQTIVWTIIFFIDTLIFLFIKLPVFAVILSNIFVLIGIILSIYDESKGKIVS